MNERLVTYVGICALLAGLVVTGSEATWAQAAPKLGDQREVENKDSKKQDNAKTDKPKPDADKDQKKTEKPKREKYYGTVTVTGEIIEADADAKNFRLRIYGTTVEPRYQPGNPYSRSLYYLPRLTAQQKKTHYDTDPIMLAEDAKIRIPPPIEKDEKGRIKAPKKSKPDPNDPDAKLGGVKGDVGDIQPRRWATVVLAKKTKDGPPVAIIVALYPVQESP
ncbi:MAG: hypothetical protein C4297_02230 [Gemmataceae bacterium]